MRQPSAHVPDTIWGHSHSISLVRSLLGGGRLPHALLLHGPDGVGKRSLAFALAKLILSSGLPVPSHAVGGPSPARMSIDSHFEPLRSDSDLFGGMDDMFGATQPEPEPPPPPPPPVPSQPAAPAEPAVADPPARKKRASPRKKSAASAEPPIEESPTPPADPIPQAAAPPPNAPLAARSTPLEPPRPASPPRPVSLAIDPRVDRLVARAYPIEYGPGDVPIQTGFVDLAIVEPLGKSKSIVVDQIRLLQDVASLRPVEGRYRVVIVFGADLITVSAANSMLKWLEEPPSYLVLLLVTDQLSGVLETIRSRCTSLPCPPLERTELARLLVEREGVEASLASVAAALAEGRPGVALSILGGSALKQRQQAFEARLALDRQGPALLPLASARALEAGGGLGPASLLLLSLVRDRLVRALAGGEDRLLVNHDLASLLDECPQPPEVLLEEAQRLLETLRQADHPAIPTPETALELALWPD